MKTDPRPTVIFIHHYGGDANSSLRHQRLIKQLGFKCVSFSLTRPHLWMKELRAVHRQTEGTKIYFTFSYPSHLVARLFFEDEPQDIAAWICDGGPFADIWSCYWNYFTYADPVRNPVFRFAYALHAQFRLSGWNYTARAREWLKAVPAELPILSLRSGADRLVPESSINAFFASRIDLNLRRQVIPGVDHLEGLKLAPEIYRSAVSSFLK